MPTKLLRAVLYTVVTIYVLFHKYRCWRLLPPWSHYIEQSIAYTVLNILVNRNVVTRQGEDLIYDLDYLFVTL